VGDKRGARLHAYLLLLEIFFISRLKVESCDGKVPSLRREFGVFFEIDEIAFTIALLLILSMTMLWHWSRAYAKPQLFFSNLKDLQHSPSGWRTRFAFLPRLLEFLTLALFLLAFIDPHFQISRGPSGDQHTPREGIAIYLVLDQSGSMAEKIMANVDGKTMMIPKIELLKQLTAKFVKGDPSIHLDGRPNDLIGLISFARGAQTLSPLTLDHISILKQLSTLNIIGKKSQDGTAIGYAIFKTVNLIAATRHYAQEISGGNHPSYDIKNSIMILVTDGLQDPNPLDTGNRLRQMSLLEAAEYAKEKGVRVYIVNIEPGISNGEFSPHRRLFKRIAELTGGKFYMMGGETNLGKVYEDIDQLEKSTLPAIQLGKISKDKQPELFQRVSFYPYLIALGMCTLLLSIVLNASILRRVP
jgi:Ca-activated chloride channel family protein